MRFGIFSNGFRPHTSAAQTYDEDLGEIVLADELGFEVAFISEHHGEPVYIDKVDTLPVPELLMCKAAALTRRIRMGAAVKVIHLHHPVDVAIQAAVTDHVIGGNRFIFGFGSGFSSPLFSQERGLTYDDRHSRLLESLDLILECWTSETPFDWDGQHWKGKQICATPRPLSRPHMPMATATESDEMLRAAGERGYTLLTAHEPPEILRRKTAKYVAGAQAGERNNALADVAHARFIYVSRSRAQAMEEIRSAVMFELDFQIRRGLLKVLNRIYGWNVSEDNVRLEDLVDLDWYIVGSPDEVAERIATIHNDSGGFGTLLFVTGKNWADRERRHQSMRLFMSQVAPSLRDLQPFGATRISAGVSA